MKKNYLSIEKKHFYLFFSPYRALQTSITNLSHSTDYSNKFGASKKLNSQRPDKLLKTEYFEKKEKKQTFHWKELYLFSSCITEYDKPQKTFCKGPRGHLTFIVQSIRYKIVSVKVRTSSENVFEKGYLFVGKNDFGLFLLYSFHQDCLHPLSIFMFCKAPTQNCAKFVILFVSRMSLFETQTLGKRAKFQWKKSFGPLLLLWSSLADFENIFPNFTKYSAGTCVSSNIISVTPK